MNKDIFEIKMGEQLRNATAPVPAGAWEAIRTNIGKSGGTATSSVSSVGAIVGLIAASVLLVSIALTSGGNKDINLSQVLISEVQVQNTIEPVAETAEPNAVSGTQADQEITVETQTVQNTPKSPVKIISGADDLDTTPEEHQKENFPELNPLNKNSASEIETSEVTNKAVKRISKTNTPNIESVQPSETSTKTNSIPVKAKIEASQTSGYAPLTVKFENKGNGSEAYWEFGTVAESHDLKPEVVFEEPGVYTVNLTATNSGEAISEDYVQITVKEGSSFYIPNAFSPNGDGINDTYKVGSAKNIKSFFLIITDEHGNTVFQTRNVNEAWDYIQTTDGNAERRYYVTYRAVGIDGKVYTAKSQLINILF